MKKTTLAALLVTSAFAFGSHAFAATTEESAAPSATEVNCLLGLPENPDAQLILIATDKNFTIKKPSSDHHEINTVYDKTPIDLFMAPKEAPFLECTQDKDNGPVAITVWENVLLVNGQYFRIDNATTINEN